jgi:hypothetical protein
MQPGGRIVLVEPYWRTTAVYLGNSTRGDDDHVLQAVLDWQITHTSHPPIGRQLRALLQQSGFTDIRVLPIAYSSTSFPLISYVLELAAAGEAAAKANPSLVSEEDVRNWFHAAEKAEADGEFYAVVVFYFGLACKGANPK